MTSLYASAAAGLLSLNNRITMAALTRMRAGENGVPTELHAEYYSQRAGVGLVVSEGTYLSAVSRGFPRQAGIGTSAQAVGWANVANAVHARGGKLAIQLMHAGRMSHPSFNGGHQPVAPSAISSGATLRSPAGKRVEAVVPRALELEELPKVREEFVAAARRAIDAGVDAVEIHSANGYLLHEFLSPVSNVREDEYGGSPRKRARFVAEVVRAVAEEVGAGRVGLRISPEHNIQGVLETDREETRATYLSLLEQIADIDLAYLSILHAEPENEFVQQLRHTFGGFTIMNTGFATITSAQEAESMVERGVGDAVAVGRMLIANPDLDVRWRTGAAVNEPDPNTFYTPGAHGFTDYPFLDAE